MDHWSFNPIAKVDIENNTFDNLIGGVWIYADGDSKTTIGRSYGFLTFSNNVFNYSSLYSVPLVTVGTTDPPYNIGEYAHVVNNIVTPDLSAAWFADPRDIVMAEDGNTAQWTGVTPPQEMMKVISGKINGTLEVNESFSFPVPGSSSPPPPPPPPPTSPNAVPSQDKSDVVGLNAVGGDDYQDEHIVLSGLAAGQTIDHVDIELMDPSTGERTGTYWQTVYGGDGHDSGAYWAVVNQSGSNADLYFQPDQDYENGEFDIVVYYIGSSITALCQN
jgi:hypothetical protein